MEYNPDIHYRRSIRLKEYNYAQAGAYFVTMCTQNRACLFGNVADGKTRLNDAGRMVEQCWREIPGHFPHADLDAFVVMPNHVHGILIIVAEVGANDYSPLPPWHVKNSRFHHPWFQNRRNQMDAPKYPNP